MPCGSGCCARAGGCGVVPLPGEDFVDQIRNAVMIMTLFELYGVYLGEIGSLTGAWLTVPLSYDYR